ncbi:Type III restriction-modification system, modification subunit [Planococcus halocryophilus Or1]|nr:hypothetical protein [Planococcus halocryophilus]EMF45555.1 Type III restriction-modification system, modification subunit [Planococcus halocryophilus Or1]
MSENTIDQLKEFDPNLIASELEVDFDKETILTTWINRDGKGLNPSINEIDFDGYTGYSIKEYLYLIDSGFSQKI